MAKTGRVASNLATINHSSGRDTREFARATWLVGRGCVALLRGLLLTKSNKSVACVT